MIVIVVDAEDDVERLRELLRGARFRFRQEAMYLEHHPVTFEEVR